MIYECKNFCHGVRNWTSGQPTVNSNLPKVEWMNGRIFRPLNAEWSFFTPRQNFFEYLRLKHTVKLHKSGYDGCGIDIE